MNEGDIIKTSLPQQDKKVKSSPVLLLKKFPGESDWLVAGISSKLHKEIKGFDFLITTEQRDYKSSGLIYPGLIRLSFLGVISENEMEGILGNISPTTHRKIIQTLKRFLAGKLNAK